MVLYLSSAINEDYFSQLVKAGKITSGHQAQKFNLLIVKGLAVHTDVCAISNPPYSALVDVDPTCQNQGNIEYHVLGSNRGILHKLCNYMSMRKLSEAVCKREKPEAIICDAINPLASMNALRVAKKYRVPAIAIITDIPEKLRGGSKFFERLTSFLMKHYHGYVLLTEAMNDFVNQKAAPRVIVEGSCEEAICKKSHMDKAEENFTCVYAGSIAPLTGIEELVDAVGHISAENFELNIYGNGKLAEWINEKSRLDKRIKYCGIVTNAEAIQAQIDANLLINPRPDNIVYGNLSFPSKVMEYMASGTPLLTTKLPGIPREYFDYLYTIDDCSAEGIARAISEVMAKSADEREDVGRRAKEFVLREKNNIRQAERIMALIDETRKQENE